MATSELEFLQTLLLEAREFFMPINIIVAVLLGRVYHLLHLLYKEESLRSAQFFRLSGVGWTLNACYLLIETAIFYQIKYDYVTFTGHQTLLMLSASTISSAIFLHASIKHLKYPQSVVLRRLASAFSAAILILGMFLLAKTPYLEAAVASSVIFHSLSLGLLALTLRRVTRANQPQQNLLHASIAWPIELYAALQVLYLVRWLPEGTEQSLRAMPVLLLTAGFMLATILKSIHLMGLAGGYLTSRIRALRDLGAQKRDLSTQRRYISQMAHELVTPAAELQLDLEEFISAAYAKKGIAPAEKTVRDVVNRILAIVRGAYDVINLEDSKIKRLIAGDGALGSREPAQACNLNTLLQASLLAVRVSLDQRPGAKDVSVHTEFTSEPVVHGRRFELMQVFINVLKNGFESFGDHPGNIQIATRKLWTGTGKDKHIRSIVVTISDTGEGISEEDLPRVTRDRFTTKGGRGRGHGLHVAKQFVEAHAGTIIITSGDHHPRGCLVRIELPTQSAPKA